ncbi:MAG: N-acetyltransferase [Chloroflexi bacterium AL-W]|nr:N-acetyltransferase [Chloroflexi bacterium AL-N1]NOK66822.1 N-acetyltransferase [Chloroflexi bacterium AL-N10]NOK74886.1 N-acetyltransferase [Chloroflexi bacterium AL-N5]NOK81425.1 N-acetyltransferase [Chloroflexi bacterium AL-W]NOK88894.1 N-acetyltransferase [Chloroflexi bacterium AL-N15]
MEATLVERLPTVAEYQRLRDHVGWGNIPDEYTEAGLQHSLYAVCLEQAGKLVGFGRVVGDGNIYFYIQDIIVITEYRGQGYSTRIMDAIIDWINAHAPDGAMVALLSVKGVEGLYEQYGFIARPSALYGAGMFQIVRKS